MQRLTHSFRMSKGRVYTDTDDVRARGNLSLASERKHELCSFANTSKAVEEKLVTTHECLKKRRARILQKDVDSAVARVMLESAHEDDDGSSLQKRARKLNFDPTPQLGGQEQTIDALELADLVRRDVIVFKTVERVTSVPTTRVATFVLKDTFKSHQILKCSRATPPNFFGYFKQGALHFRVVMDKR